ncbi:SMI1/KNR4 family protein [Nocardia sp. NPDC049149]|uniref:SMI1/KNR4 family protein n=1 Tax=Nocardia sp. NPDC049149 TaxID=3364315 RepID=UPI003713BA0F
MSDSGHARAIDRVHALFQDVLAHGLRADAVSGATNAEIDGMAVAQQAAAVPAALREILRLIGYDRGPYFGDGSAFGVELRLDEKSMALEFFDEVAAPPAEFRDPEGMLVLHYHGGYQVCVLDGADLDEPDPPVWLLREDGELARLWSTTTEWFSGVCAEVTSRVDQLGRARHQPDLGWAAYFC